MEQNNSQTAQLEVAVYHDISGEMYRLVYPVAVHLGDEIKVAETVQKQCQNKDSGIFCITYYPPDIDAVIVLRVRHDLQRDVNVICYSHNKLCDKLRQLAERLWKWRQRPLGPEEFIDALVVGWHLY